MTVGGQADTVFCFNKPCKCRLYTAPRNNLGEEEVQVVGFHADLIPQMDRQFAMPRKVLSR